MNNKVGFMQGRLSDQVNNLIQAFPSQNWKQEFKTASEININLMEWTLDYDNLYENPIMTIEGRKEIKSLSEKYSILIPSITADCFMQKPFWKSKNNEMTFQQKVFKDVSHASSKLGIKYIIVPLVDNGSILNKAHENHLVNFLVKNKKLFENLNLQILFESDFTPKKLGEFIRKFPSHIFGINYDTGNSAAAGYDPSEEFYHYGTFIKNVHIKDRKKNGTTIALQEGDTDFDKVFINLKTISYKGNFILQTARDKDKNHAKAISTYRDLTKKFINKYLCESIIEKDKKS